MFGVDVELGLVYLLLIREGLSSETEIYVPTYGESLAATGAGFLHRERFSERTGMGGVSEKVP